MLAAVAAALEQYGYAGTTVSKVLAKNYPCSEGECKAWLRAGSDQSGVTCELYCRRLMTAAQLSGE